MKLLADPAPNHADSYFLSAIRQMGAQGGRARDLLYNIFKSYDRRERFFHDWDHACDKAAIPDYMLQGFLKSFRHPEGRGELDPGEVARLMPALVVAGLGHDRVYLKVDNGFPAADAAVLSRFAMLGGNDERPFRATLSDDGSPIGEIVRTVFNFKPNELITETPQKFSAHFGLNEFLSAIVQAEGLTQGTAGLSQKALHAVVTVSALLEATIPFRPNDVFEELFTRLRGLGFNARSSEIIIKAGIMLANHDVGDFSGTMDPHLSTLSEEDRFRKFLIGTWKLIPENSQPVSVVGYTPGAYLAAVKKDHTFICQIINRQNIYHSFRGYPDQAEMAARYEHTNRNINLLDAYMTAVIASASIIEAVARNVDPDGRVSLAELASDLRLPLTDKGIFHGDNQIVFNALHNRSVSDAFEWDRLDSKVAPYLMQELRVEGIREIAAWAEGCDFSKRDVAIGFIERLKGDPTKSAALETLLGSLQERAEFIEDLDLSAHAPLAHSRVSVIRSLKCGNAYALV